MRKQLPLHVLFSDNHCQVSERQMVKQCQVAQLRVFGLKTYLQGTVKKTQPQRGWSSIGLSSGDMYPGPCQCMAGGPSADIVAFVPQVVQF